MAAFSSNIDITSGGTYGMDVTNGESSLKVANDLNGKMANIQQYLQNGLPEVWTGDSLPDSLPNGKYIYFNSNTYQPNLLRLLTQTDYNTLNSSINDVITQINAMKIVYTRITRNYTTNYNDTVIYTMPSSARLVIAWAYLDVTDGGYACVTIGGTRICIAVKSRTDKDESYGIGIMGDSITTSIVKYVGGNVTPFVYPTEENTICVYTDDMSGKRASIDVSILTFT